MGMNEVSSEVYFYLSGTRNALGDATEGADKSIEAVFYQGGSVFTDIAYAIDNAKSHMYLSTSRLAYTDSDPAAESCFVYKSTGAELLCYGICAKHLFGRESNYYEIIFRNLSDMRDGIYFINEVLGKRYLSEREAIACDGVGQGALNEDGRFARAETVGIDEIMRRSICHAAEAVADGKKIALIVPKHSGFSAKNVLAMVYELLPARRRCEISYTLNRKRNDQPYIKDIAILVCDSIKEAAEYGRELISLDAEPASAPSQLMLDLSQRTCTERDEYNEGIQNAIPLQNSSTAEDMKTLLSCMDEKNVWWKQDSSRQSIATLKDLITKHSHTPVLNIARLNEEFIKQIPSLISSASGIRGLIESFYLADQTKDQEKYETYCADHMRYCGMNRTEFEGIREDCMDYKKIIADVESLTQNVSQLREDVKQSNSYINSKLLSMNEKISGDLSEMNTQSSRNLENMNTQFSHSLDDMKTHFSSLNIVNEKISRDLSDIKNVVGEQQKKQMNMEQTISALKNNQKIDGLLQDRVYEIGKSVNALSSEQKDLKSDFADIRDRIRRGGDFRDDLDGGSTPIKAFRVITAVVLVLLLAASAILLLNSFGIINLRKDLTAAGTPAGSGAESTSPDMTLLCSIVNKTILTKDLAFSNLSFSAKDCGGFEEYLSGTGFNYNTACSFSSSHVDVAIVEYTHAYANGTVQNKLEVLLKGLAPEIEGEETYYLCFLYDPDGKVQAMDTEIAETQASADHISAEESGTGRQSAENTAPPATVAVKVILVKLNAEANKTGILDDLKGIHPDLKQIGLPVEG
jgi:hypothetical protein